MRNYIVGLVIISYFILFASPTLAITKGDYVLNQINQYRQQNGKPQARKETKTCNFAYKRAKEISSSFSHSGFNSTSIKQAYGSYHYVTENLARTSNYLNVNNMWINSSGHRRNLLADTPYICVGVYGNNYVMEGFRP